MCIRDSVGSKHLNFRLVGVRAEGLEQKHRDGVDLLAGGAPGHPDAKRGEPPSQMQLREYALSQSLKALRIAKEARDVDEDVVGQRLELGGILPQERHIVVQRRNLVQSHPARDAAADGGLLIPVSYTHLRGAR